MKLIYMNHTISLINFRGADVYQDEGEELIQKDDYIILKS